MAVFDGESGEEDGDVSSHIVWSSSAVNLPFGEKN